MDEEQAELERFQHDVDYYESHREELFEQHAEEWVAIFNQQVVGAASEFEHLLKDLKEKGLPPEQVLVEHLTSQEELLILSL